MGTSVWSRFEITYLFWGSTWVSDHGPRVPAPIHFPWKFLGGDLLSLIQWSWQWNNACFIWQKIWNPFPLLKSIRLALLIWRFMHYFQELKRSYIKSCIKLWYECWHHLHVQVCELSSRTPKSIDQALLLLFIHHQSVHYVEDFLTTNDSNDTKRTEYRNFCTGPYSMKLPGIVTRIGLRNKLASS